MERELILLGLLKREEMHGYQLHEFIDNTMQTCVDIKKPTAYYLLDKMTQQGFISRTDEKAGNRPTRHVYRLTPLGEKRFQTLLRKNLGNYRQNRYPNNTGILFLEELPTDEAIKLLTKRYSVIQSKLEEAKAAPPHSGSMQFVIDHQITMLDAELSWLGSVIDHLHNQLN